MVAVAAVRLTGSETVVVAAVVKSTGSEMAVVVAAVKSTGSETAGAAGAVRSTGSEIRASPFSDTKPHGKNWSLIGVHVRASFFTLPHRCPIRFLALESLRLSNGDLRDFNCFSIASIIIPPAVLWGSSIVSFFCKLYPTCFRFRMNLFETTVWLILGRAAFSLLSSPPALFPLLQATALLLYWNAVCTESQCAFPSRESSWDTTHRCRSLCFDVTRCHVARAPSAVKHATPSFFCASSWPLFCAYRT